VQKLDWRAFGVPDSGAIAELGPKDQISAGEGIWLIRKNPMTITKSAVMPPLQTNGTTAVVIHNGWNII
jgi:hypothetical protein